MAAANLNWCLIAWWPNHLFPKFSNSIQHILEMVVDSLYGPSPVVLYNSKSLVMTNNVEKHGYLLFNTRVNVICKQFSIPKQVAQTKKWLPSHVKHVHTLYVIIVVHQVKVPLPLLVPNAHWPITDLRPMRLKHSKSSRQQDIHGSDESTSMSNKHSSLL
jgi:hypothetical protein